MGPSLCFFGSPYIVRGLEPPGTIENVSTRLARIFLVVMLFYVLLHPWFNWPVFNMLVLPGGDLFLFVV